MNEVVILAGGFGTRLRSLVNDKPKCMAEINNIPFIKYLIDNLIEAKFTHIIFSLGYLSEIVISFLNNYKFKNCKYTYVVENNPLGTGGAIKNAIKFSNEQNILILNGDTYVDINFMDFLEFHKSKNSLCTISVLNIQDASRYGSIEFNNQMKITKFIEKKNSSNVYINAGYIYIQNNIFINYLSEIFSFENDFLPVFMNSDCAYAYPIDSYFIDIGIPETYIVAQTTLKKYCK